MPGTTTTPGAAASPSSRVTTTFGDLVADSSGTADGHPPLVLLHGFSFGRTTWSPVLEALDEIDPGRRIVAFDLPGHGDSPPLASHDAENVVAAIRRAVLAAGLEPPVLVGHSISAVFATLYAALYPAAGVISVDQSLRIGPFATLLKSFDERLRGPDFDAVWSIFADSMHAELLPPTGQQLVRATCHPDQRRFLEYQREILELPLAEFDGRLHMLFAVLRAGGRPYQVIAGDGFTDADRAWLLQRLPHATITTWRGTGHFPHLAHPQAFAEHLAATATTPRVGHEPDPEDSARVELGRSRATTSRWSDSAGSQATPRPCVMS